ncbi:MAG: fructose-1 6-bisphosphatase II [Hyphomonadaceae bacterium]|nr:MAG: fructose-1 6-bisphosphatase II [Hyphomonadaceae bacterium]
MTKQLSFEIEAGAICAVEEAAIGAFAHVGLGDEMQADRAAIAHMHAVLAELAMSGHVVFGEGDEYESALLFDGEKLGQGGLECDIALDALEGTTLAAKAMQNALSVIAISPKGGLLRVPDIYMDKIAIGPNFPQGIIDLDKSTKENIEAVANYKGVAPNRIGVCVLDRPRHADLIAELREIGARVYLIPDGDVAGVIFTTEPSADVDLYMGIGGAPEGVLAAAALACVGGQFQGRMVVKSESDKAKLRQSGIEDYAKKYDLQDLISGEVIFAACGVTDGSFVKGVRHYYNGTETHVLLLRSNPKIRRVVNTMRLNGHE